MRKSKPVKIVVISVLSLVILVFLIQTLLGVLITKKLDKRLSDKKGMLYKIEIGKAKVNLFSMTLILKNITIEPDSGIIEAKSASQNQKTFARLQIPKLRLKNINLLKFISDKQIDLNSIIINNANIIIYLDKSDKQPQTKPNKVFSLNSIPIKELNGIEIDEIDLLNISLSLLDFANHDTILALKKLNIKIDTLAFEKNKGQDSTLMMRMADLDIKMLNARFPNLVGEYDLSFDELFLQTKDSTLSITNLEFRPTISLRELAFKTRFQKEFYTIRIEDFKTDISQIKQILSGGDFHFSAVDINNMVIRIYKDKRKPFDKSREPKLPNQLLKQLRFPLCIDSISINNSRFIYSERHNKIKDLMTLTLSDMNLKFKGVTSIEKQIENGAILTIDLSAKMQKEIPFELFMEFPLNSVSDTFSFQGELGFGDLLVFNSILMPVIGMTLESGKLDNLKFSARANPNYSMGEMTMLYSDLKADIRNLKKQKSNVLYTWIVNSVIFQSNPVNGNPIRITPLYTERVKYKGLGNFIWKTAQSGIMGTIVPTQKNRARSKHEELLGFTKEQIKKRKKRERKERKNRKKQ